MNKLNYDFLECARLMPPLKHSAEKPFDITKSEVSKWLVNQPQVMQKVFNMAANKKVLCYNSETEEWQGVDFVADD